MAQRLQIFGVHFHVGVRLAGEGGGDRQRPSPATSPPAGLRLEPVLRGPRHRPRLESARSSRASPPPASPSRSPTGRSSSSSWRRWCRPRPSARSEVWWDIRPTRTSAPWSCACATASRRSARWRRWRAGPVLVHWFDTMHDRGYQLPVHREWVLRQNKWRAARHGLEASLIIDDEGSTRPVKEVIAELLDELHPIATRLGCTDEPEGRPPDPRPGRELRAPTSGARWSRLARGHRRSGSTSSSPTSREPARDLRPAHLDGVSTSSWRPRGRACRLPPPAPRPPELSWEEHQTTAPLHPAGGGRPRAPATETETASSSTSGTPIG